MVSATSTNETKTAVLAIDIGGGTMKWSLVGVNPDGKLGNLLEIGNGQSTAEENYHQAVKTPKSWLSNFVAAYDHVLRTATLKAKEQGVELTGVGIGSPGRFISRDDYRLHYTKNGVSPHERLGIADQMNLGDPYGKNLVPKHDVDTRVIAPGSNPNLAVQKTMVDGHEVSYSELDGVALPALLQSATPAGVKVRMGNDAAVQMQAIVNGLNGAFDGKKSIYLGFGTGLGAAVMNEKGELVTDGHFQHTTIAKRANAVDAEVYEDIRRYFLGNGELSPDKNIPTGEMLFSATKTINRIMQESFSAKPSLQECERRMQNPAGDAEAQHAIERLQAIGRYMADFVKNVREGKFTHRDPAAEWSDADKGQVAGFESIVFGGVLAKTVPFNQFILPAMKDELKTNHGIDAAAVGEPGSAALRYVCADEQTKEQTMKASASLIDKATLLRTPEEIMVANKARNAHAV